MIFQHKRTGFVAETSIEKLDLVDDTPSLRGVNTIGNSPFFLTDTLPYSCSGVKVSIKTEIRAHNTVFFTAAGIAFVGTVYMPAVSHVAVVVQEYQKDTLLLSNDGSQHRKGRSPQTG